MASTRNRNTTINYNLEQRQYSQSSSYTLYPNSQYGAAYNTMLSWKWFASGTNSVE